MRLVSLAAIAAASLSAVQAAAADNAFALGQIVVTAPRVEGIAIGGGTLSSDAIYAFNRNTLDDAASLIPGVSAGNSGGSRNERLLFVRGFDRFQVPLSIDGIRVYLPADNRLDYGRFLTPDIAEIQVAKGYASVLDGPGALGGAVNLVTRKPTKAIEAEVRGTLNLDRDVDYAGYNVSGVIGTAREKWYAQASYTRSFTDHWDLPGGYSPVAGSAENGGERDFSRSRDWRVNAKLGFTPNETDEYSISYTRQEGSKNAPLHVTDPVSTPLPTGAPNPRYWTWPYWNIDSIYFLSMTALGDQAVLKTRIYRNKFTNLLSSFDDATQTAQSMPRAFNSYYSDEAWGGSAQLDVDLTDADRFSLAAHYRRDKHRERQDGFYRTTTAPIVTVPYSEPWQANIENTYSLAAENVLKIDPALTFTAGASFDWRDTKKAEEYTIPPANFFQYAVKNVQAFNWQGRFDWRPDELTAVHASVSRRTRFPTVFERFSTQFGTAASNPGLKPEKSTNYEIGFSRTLGTVRAEAAVFYSDLTDAIVSIRPAGSPAGTTQRQNLGNGDYYGAELSLTYRPMPTLELGANYTFIKRDFKIGTPAPGVTVPMFALTDVPKHKAFVYASWQPIERLHVVPSIDIASSRVVLDSYFPALPATVRYYRTGAYVLGNARVDYDLTDMITLGVGVRNAFDRNYQLADGFPEPGRSFFASVRARY